MRYIGSPVSEGVAIARVFLYRPDAPAAEHQYLTGEQVPAALSEYEAALDTVDKELAAMAERSDIFVAHRELLRDEEMTAAVRAAISEERQNCAWAIETVYDMYAGLFSQLDDPLLRERAADLRDIGRRLIRICTGGQGGDLTCLPEPCIVVAHDLYPSDTATLDRENVLGVITEVGGPTCHSAIIARSYGLPAVLGVPGILDALNPGDTVVLDALTGAVLTSPSAQDISAYAQAAQDFSRRKAQAAQWRDKPCFTQDGVRVEVGINVASPNPEDIAALKSSGVDYVGLFRTEFVYMNAKAMPTEEEQFTVYKHLLSAAGDKPVTLRTLDIGGDKTLPYYQLPQEENPVLGCRALRLCLSDTELFRIQLRAALRAARFGKLQLMLPMVGSLDDFLAARAMVEEVQAELDTEGIPYGKDYKLGAMIEIPSAALIADILAQYVDFASIGTNDLSQYLLAVDRMNANVSGRYYQSYHPAVFRLISYVVEQFSQVGKPVSVCGELGGDPLAAPVLVGMGMRHLSMSPSRLDGVKLALSSHTAAQLGDLANRVKDLATAGEIEALLRKELL